MHTLTHNHTIISLENVSFRYATDPIIKGVTLAIHKGDYVGIVGPNGGGKSTLMKLMVGLIEPFEGSIKLFGTAIKDFKEWDKIGYVPQRMTFDEQFPITVEEVVMMGRYGKLGLFKHPGKKDHEKVKEALKQVGMEAFSQRQIHDLSGGQQQRVFIAKALVSEPEVIFLDEPTVGIDMKTQKQFYELLRVLNRELHITLVLVSHEVDIMAHESTEFGYINCTLDYFGDPETFLQGKYFHELIGKKGIHH